jgi:TolB-like protein/DNA-binding winged helix-turn-helix (wHTH) protein/Flp pilus assembly protein TadD
VSSNLDLSFPKVIQRMDKSSAQIIYEFGDFRLDADHLMLYRRSKEVQLAPKAVETLLALIERDGEIVSKDELLSRIWPDSFVEEANLFLYLSAIRKTLGNQEDGTPYLETRRRRGYRFNGRVRLMPTERPAPVASIIQTPETVHVANFSRPITEAGTVKPQFSVVLPERQRLKWFSRRLLFSGACLIALVAITSFPYVYFTNPRPIESIAVMPFANETRDSELEYVPDAMTDSFITSLSKIPELKVEARSSVFRYKGKKTDPRTIGTALGVDAVLFGNVIKRGEDIEVHVELVDGQSGVRVWEATDTQRMADLLVLERRIQRELVTKLGFGQPGSAEREVSSKRPTSTDAYLLYTKGRLYSLKLTPLEIREGIDYLYLAVEKDPAYALAYAGIARAHLILGIAGEARPSEFIKAKLAAQKAIELDVSLAEGYSALAGVAFFYDRNFPEAERLYQRALDLDPKNATAHQQYADFLNKTGRREEGRAEIARAMELEPFSPFINAFYAVSIPDNDDALEQIQFAIDQLGRDNYLVHMFAAEIYRRKEMYHESIAELRRAKELSPRQTLSDVALIGALVRVGKTDEARVIADRMLRESKTGYIPPTHLALAYKQLGDRSKAFAHLEDAFEVRDPKIVFLNEPMWNDRDDPQFQDVLRRVGFAL